MTELAETSEILAFAKIVQAKSLSRAAAELAVPRATISRRLSRLEERLGVRLLRRTTRSLVLTDAGEAFYRHAQRVLEAVAQAEQSVRVERGAIRGALRVSAPPLMNEAFFTVLADFAKRYPEVQLHVHFATRYVDLKREGYDAAIRASTELEPGLVARTLLLDTFDAVASPEYLAKHGVPRSTRELRAHRCLLGFARGELPQTHWPLRSGGKLHVEGCFFSNEIALLAAAAVDGLGITMLPGVVAAPYLQSGQLVRVLPEKLGADSRVSVVYLERELMPPQVRAFVDTLVNASATLFSQPMAACGPRATTQRSLAKTAQQSRKTARPRSKTKTKSSRTKTKSSRTKTKSSKAKSAVH